MDKELCVLVHSFTGSPAELEPLEVALQDEGYLTETPLLPGHEGDKDALRTATASAWISTVESVVQDGLEQGYTVHIVGFSMGALIGAILSTRYPIATLTMLAPAIYHTGPSVMFRQMAGMIKSTWAQGTMNLDYVRGRLDRLSQTPIASVRQFRRVVQLAKSALPKVTVPVCIVQGSQDLIVDPSGASYVYGLVQSEDREIHYLEDSGHLLCFDEEVDELNRIVIEFLEKHETTLLV